MTTKKEPQVRKPRAAKPAADPVSRERQLTSLAVDLAEKQLRDGSASPSVINHFLKIASTREAIEREILEQKILEFAQKRNENLGNYMTRMNIGSGRYSITTVPADSMRVYKGKHMYKVSVSMQGGD